MDATKYAFLPDYPKVRWTLHVALDQQSGWLVGLYFDKEETTNGYFQIVSQMLTRYGVPRKILADNRQVFRNGVKESKLTQFGFMAKNLGIELKTSSKPTFKAKVERCNYTLQQDLPDDLKERGINTIEEANAYLEEYIIKYNAARAIEKEWENIFDSINKEEINCACAIFDIRSANNGHVLKYRNKSYFLLDSNGDKFPIPSGSEALIVTTFDRRMYALYEGVVFALLAINVPYESINVKEYAKVPNVDYLWNLNNYKRYISMIAESRSSRKKKL